MSREEHATVHTLINNMVLSTKAENTNSHSSFYLGITIEFSIFSTKIMSFLVKSVSVIQEVQNNGQMFENSVRFNLNRFVYCSVD